MAHFDLNRRDIYSVYPSFMYPQIPIGNTGQMPISGVQQSTLHPAYYSYPHLPGLYRNQVVPQFLPCPGASQVVYNTIRQISHSAEDLTRYPFDMAVFDHPRISDLGFSHGFGPPGLGYSSPVPPTDPKIEMRSSSALDPKFYGCHKEQTAEKRPASTLEMKPKKKKRSKSPVKEINLETKITLSAMIKSEKANIDLSPLQVTPITASVETSQNSRNKETVIDSSSAVSTAISDKEIKVENVEWRAKSCEPTLSEPLDLSIRPRSKTLPTSAKDTSKTFVSKSDRLEQSINNIKQHQHSLESLEDFPKDIVPENSSEILQSLSKAVEDKGSLTNLSEKADDLFDNGGCSRTTPFAKVVLACKQAVEKREIFCTETLAHGSDSLRINEEQKIERPAQLLTGIPNRQGGVNDTDQMISDKNTMTSAILIKTERSPEVLRGYEDGAAGVLETKDSPEVLRSCKPANVCMGEELKVCRSPLLVETGKQSPYCTNFFSPGHGIYPNSPLLKLKSPRFETDVTLPDRTEILDTTVSVKVEKEDESKKSGCLLSKKQGSIPVGIAVARQRAAVTAMTVNHPKLKTQLTERQNVPIAPRQSEPLLFQIAPGSEIVVQNTNEPSTAWSTQACTGVDQQVGISKQSVWVGTAATFSAGNDITRMILPQTLPISNIGYQVPSGNSPLLLIPAACLDSAQRPSILWPAYQPTWTTASPVVSIGPPQPQGFQPTAVTIQHQTSYKMVTPVVQQGVGNVSCYEQSIKEEKQDLGYEPAMPQSFVAEGTTQTTTSVVGFMSPICPETISSEAVISNCGNNLTISGNETPVVKSEDLVLDVKVETSDLDLISEEGKGNSLIPPRQDAVIQTDTPESSDNEYEVEGDDDEKDKLVIVEPPNEDAVSTLNVGTSHSSSEFKTLEVGDIGLSCFPLNCDLKSENFRDAEVPEKQKVQEVESMTPDLSGLKLLMDSIDKVEARKSAPCEGLDLLSTVAETRLLQSCNSSDNKTFDSLCTVASTYCDSSLSEVVPSLKKDDFVMDPVELEMRIRMAELQRKYREKRKELNRLDELSPTKRVSVARKFSVSETRMKKNIGLETGKKRSKSASDKQDNVILELNEDKQQITAGVAISSSKKRKLGFPKKNQSKTLPTETIVPKKSKMYGMMLNNNDDEWNPRATFRGELKTTSLGSDLGLFSISTPSATPPESSGRSPSLETPPPPLPDCWKLPETSADQIKNKSKSSRPIKKHLTPEVSEVPENTVPRPPLAEELVDKLRVLVPNEGLLSAGHVTPLSPPDIYGVVLDGERKNKPRIYSREEILMESILEVHAVPSTTRPGTRVCAFWSHKSRVLYPGRVAVTLEQSKGKNWVVDIEFDDGDSGLIHIEDVRLLPDDYPVKEYNADPLKVLERHRKRRDSSQDTSIASTTAPVEEESIVDKNENDEGRSSKKKKKRGKDKKKDKHKHKKSKKEKSQKDEDRADYSMSSLVESSPDSESSKNLKRKRREKIRDENSRRHKSDTSHKSKRKSNNPSIKFSMDDQPLLFQSLISPSRPDFEKEEDIQPLLLNSPALSVEQLSPDLELQIPEKTELPNETPLSCDEEVKIASTTVAIPEEACSLESMAKLSDEINYSDDEMSDGGAAECLRSHAWEWYGPGVKKKKKTYYKAIKRGDEIIRTGECALFFSTACATEEDARPYIGRISSMWSTQKGSRVPAFVKVRWLYFPEDIDKIVRPEPGTILEGGLFESNHTDENSLQTIDRKVEVISASEYRSRITSEGEDLSSDVYYNAGFYNVTTKQLDIRLDIV
ncbi:uncharacterized protein LOC136039152 isoform X2 [Artemia franciscana]|uniref:BAH domain-containing protein n=1 Tax=Artemia franciscana TaxID=6661 RepID=A0AA88I700_ARTSF|nr:hypothetical protein QYM36_006835 [Artemia franciscana]